MVCLFPVLLAMKSKEHGYGSLISGEARYGAMAPVLVILWDQETNKEIVSPSLRQVQYKEHDENWQIWL